MWEKRDAIENKQLPGIYLIAITNKNLGGKRPRWGDVSYIGMTHAKNGLCSRWNQFNNSIHGNEQHSGGNTVHKKLGDYKNWKKMHLYVCCMPISCNVDKGTRDADDLIRMGKIAFLEYHALAEFKKATGREPEYNTR